MSQLQLNGKNRSSLVPTVWEKPWAGRSSVVNPQNSYSNAKQGRSFADFKENASMGDGDKETYSESKEAMKAPQGEAMPTGGACTSVAGNAYNHHPSTLSQMSGGCNRCGRSSVSPSRSALGLAPLGHTKE